MEKTRKHSRKRDAILACLQHTTTHPTAEWVYHQLKPDIPDLSLGTVYRNLAMFRREGIIRSLGTVDGQERFDFNTAPHAHFICRRCHAIVDVPQPVLPVETLETVCAATSGQVDTCDIAFSGLCGACILHSKSV